MTVDPEIVRLGEEDVVIKNALACFRVDTVARLRELLVQGDVLAWKGLGPARIARLRAVAGCTWKPVPEAAKEGCVEILTQIAWLADDPRVHNDVVDLTRCLAKYGNVTDVKVRSWYAKMLVPALRKILGEECT